MMHGQKTIKLNDGLFLLIEFLHMVCPVTKILDILKARMVGNI
jgi:hypothetical protein